MDAAQDVLEQVLSGRIVAGDIRLSSAALASRGVTAIVGVTGEAEGRVLYDMGLDTALRIARAMNGEDAPSEFDQLGKDTLSELAAMMTGRAISTLNDQGHRLHVTPPTLFAGLDVTISHSDLETLVVPLETSFGEVVVNVAVATG